MKTTPAVLIIFLLPLAIGAQNDARIDTVQGYPMQTVLEKGDIPAIYDPQFVDARQADEFYFDDEPLMIVAGEKVAHAYSIWHLDHHEIVNDRIDGLPLAATW